MGCASSKHEQRCLHCNSPYAAPPRRSYSVHVQHPAQVAGEEIYNHVVALKSSTLGSINLNSSHQNINIQLDDLINVSRSEFFHIHTKRNDEVDINSNENNDKKVKEFSVGLIEAKTWSNMICEKIPKSPRTPIQTPPGEPETINTWELMEGLEDVSPFRSPNHLRSFSFNIGPNPTLDHDHSFFDSSKLPNLALQEKPMWLQMAENDVSDPTFISDFDPDVISSFRRSLEELSSDNPFHLRPKDDVNLPSNDVIGCKKGNGNNKVKAVLYFTSLRGVRKTYEDCCQVKLILKSIGVRVDERDVSMHSEFKEELKELLGEVLNVGGLPRVFVGEKYIGGADEIRKMHEDGVLEKVFDCCENVEDGVGACEACGDVRFVPCDTCSGSCKVYQCEGEGQEEEQEVEEGDFGFQRCPNCNENGLIRCPVCCSN